MVKKLEERAARNMSGGRRERPKIFRVVVVVIHLEVQTKLLTTERKVKWIAAICRVDMTEIKLADHRVSGRLFVTVAARPRPKAGTSKTLTGYPALNHGRHLKYPNSF